MQFVAFFRNVNLGQGSTPLGRLEPAYLAPLEHLVELVAAHPSAGYELTGLYAPKGDQDAVQE